jgi:hypothetical protein
MKGPLLKVAWDLFFLIAEGITQRQGQVTMPRLNMLRNRHPWTQTGLNSATARLVHRQPKPRQHIFKMADRLHFIGFSILFTMGLT